MSEVSVVIPTLNAAPYLPALFEALQRQQPLPPREVVIVDSGSRDGTRELAQAHDRVRLVDIERFTHGAARNLGAREAAGDVLVFLTQDALPADEHWLAHLVAALDQDGVAAVYSRQIPRPDAKPMEVYYLSQSFPAGATPVRRATPGRELSHRDIFFSNVSSAVRRDAWLAHPFEESLIMSEDQQLARDLLRAGLAVAYASRSLVIHSHNYPLRTVFKRYLDSAFAVTELLPRHGLGSTVSAGCRYVRGELGFILRRHPLWLPYYLAHNAAKVTGVLLGHAARHLPASLLRRLSLHGYHWSR